MRDDYKNVKQVNCYFPDIARSSHIAACESITKINNTVREAVKLKLINKVLPDIKISSDIKARHIEKRLSYLEGKKKEIQKY